MSLILKTHLTNPTHITKFIFPNIHHHYKSKPTIIPKLPLFSNPPITPFHSQNHQYHFHLKSYNSSTFSLDEDRQKPVTTLNFDSLLSLLETLCLSSSIVIALGCFINGVLLKEHTFGLLVNVGKNVLVWLLVGSIAIGSLIRRRQWRRYCGPVEKKVGLGLGNEGSNLIERIEKLEDSMKSATTIIRMLSRQLEKLGIRFRVMRKALRDPISETAALAQMNSEATRALSMQEDILEKELAEVQKVLLAMQEQQQKQLELILAIAKSGKLLETKPAPITVPEMHEKESVDRSLRQTDGQHVQTIVGKSGAASEKALG